ncbi:hypothetical protein PYCCODRAFT_1374607 [Trametes coccinea BRFM310]|uniref:Spherulin 4-like cell surface protein n=1 Tax=Trametes coccinea (strain BRFM310) TaxID=1353009 RepID=A0A1Y2IE59_TRAC3|nr:hypothetical protein PYCCODRAFT_1374607 [Trametes coccinea BRFM310]
MIVPRALLAAAATLSSGVLIPFYIDPLDTKCTPWVPLFNTIAAHPTVPFWVVINPNSGPGNNGGQAPKTYRACIPKLRAPNVLILGYVHTSYGKASRKAGVTQDVNTYAGWNATYRPDGIFFDEVSGEKKDLATYKGFVSQARPLFNGGNGFISLNPGTAPDDSDYYTIADLVLSDELFYDQFDPSTLHLGSATPPSKQAIVLTDGPSTPPTSLIEQVVTQDHIKAFYVTTDSQANGANPYDDLPTDLESYIAAIQAAQ